ncbi:protein kinase [Tolypothrix campylonemoides VB511288]|nr:protein kinase [Tolypothrix campylonemoides VB511288]
MSYCLNPYCQKPASNPPTAKFCQSCGTKLLLKDRYRAIKLIGQGGFGKTFLAVDEDKPSKPPCVIKQFCPEAQGTNNTQKAAELFEREALRLDELGKHNQIPELFAHFTQDNRQYLVQEFIDGQNLAEILAEQGAFNEGQIQDLLNSLLPVLEYIHNQSVIHRDIKPENIIHRNDGQLVLVDFGAAKYVTASSELQPGTNIGSPEFVAPEQVMGKAIFASDLYSLGITCIYLLTQVSPLNLFDISEYDWVWRQYLVNNPVSDKLGRILDKLIQQDIDCRYKSATEVLEDLNPTSVKPLSVAPSNTISVAHSNTINYPSFRNIHTLSHSDAVFGVAFSPDGQILASCSGYWDKSIKLWDVGTGQQLCTFQGLFDGVRCVTFSPDGQILASGSSSRDPTIKLWDVSSGQKKKILKGHSDVVYSLAFTPDGQTLVSGSQDKTIKLWDVLTGRELSTIKYHHWVRSVAVSLDGHILACGSNDRTIRLWNMLTGRQLCTLKGHFFGVSSVKFSPDDLILASGSDDRTVKLWNVHTAQEIYTFDRHSSAVFSIAFSPDGQILASGSDDDTIKLWDVMTGEEICTLNGHSSGVNSIRFSPNGKALASCSSDNTVKIWHYD